MINNTLVKQTVYVSLLMQLVTTLISLDGLNYNLLPRDSVLHDILILEAIVQFIEAGFYIWVILALKDLDKMTSRRYIDWVFTTPTMLVSTIVFMEYLRVKQENKDSFTLIEFVKSHKQDILRQYKQCLDDLEDRAQYLANMNLKQMSSTFCLADLLYQDAGLCTLTEARY